MKKIVAMTLILSLLFSMFAFDAFAWNPGDLQIENLATGINGVVGSMGRVGVQAGNFTKAFNMFASACTGVANFLTIANGSVEFLKLIGVMKDPVEQGIENILNKLGAMDDRLAEMQSSINDIASAMTELQATTAINERGRKASELLGIWRNFSERNMEDTLDAYMNEYASRTMTDLRKWCRNEDGFRSTGDVHTDSVTVFYGEQGEQIFSCLEKQAALYKKEKNYVVLPAALLPGRVVWDVNSYQDDIAAAIEENIRAALEAGDYELFADASGIDWLTEEGKDGITDGAVAALAYDAMEALTYQICFNIANDPQYSLADKTFYAFENFYSHLTAEGEGLDAWIQSLYLTHAFEFQVKDVIRDFTDRVNIKTGVYSLFVANMIGMSDTLTDAQKEQAMKDVAGALEYIGQAYENSLTGKDNFCYIVTAPVTYESHVWQSTYSAFTEEWSNIFGTYRRYEGYGYAEAHNNVNYEFGGEIVGNELIGSVEGMTVINTLKGAGVGDGQLHSYFRDHLGFEEQLDYGCIVLSSSGEMTLPVNGDVPFRCEHIIGNWFKNGDGARLNKLPGDAGSGQLKCRMKMEGDAYDTLNGKLDSNRVLVAAALYGEGHGYWKKDEVAAYGGPCDYAGFQFLCDDVYLGADEHRYDVYVNSYYNCLCIETDRSVRLTGTGSEAQSYEPLKGLEALNAKLAEPTAIAVTPVPLPTVLTVTDMELGSLVWCDIEEDDEKILEAALVRIEEALREAGKTMTEAEKKELAAEMAVRLRAAEKELLSGEELQPEDPLGLGQNTEALRAFAKGLLPAYMKEADGSLSPAVRYLFSRLLYEAFPVVDLSGAAPDIRIAYHVTPYLVVGECVSGFYDCRTLEIPAAYLKETGTAVTLRLPAGEAPKAVVLSMDDYDRMNEVERRALPVRGTELRYVELTPAAEERVFLTANGREVPSTGDTSNTWLYACVFGLSLLVLLFLLLRKRKH